MSEDVRPTLSSLFEAIADGDPDGVRRCLEAGVDPNARDDRPRTKGRTPLFAAALREEERIVDLLLEAGAEPDLRDREEGRRTTPLDCVRLADLRWPEPRGLTPLMVATVVDAPGIVARLVAAGATLDLLDDSRHDALAIALVNDCRDVALALLAAGARADLPLAEKRTALHLALDHDLPDLALEMIGRGTRGDLADRDGDTALHVAASMGHDDVVRELLRRGADPTAKNRDGEDVLAVDGGLGEATRRLLEALGAGADLEEAFASVPDGPSWSVDPELRRSYAPTRVRARLGALSAVGGFRAAVAELSERIGVPARDETAELGVVSFVLPAGFEVESSALREVADRHTSTLVASAFDFEDRPETLALLPTADPYCALSVFELNGANLGLDTAAIIAWWKARESRLDVRFTGVTHDTLLGEWRTPPPDPRKLAGELEELCPDLVDQGFGDVEALAAYLAESRTFRLWWD